MERTKKESKLQKMFREDDTKLSAILYMITSIIWSFCAFMSYHSVVTYGSGRTSLYLYGSLALLYLGLALGAACKHAKKKKTEKQTYIA